MTGYRPQRIAGALAVVILALALAGTAVAGCGESARAESSTLKLSEADNGKTFAVKVGDTIEVILAGNPTTGYQWEAGLDSASGAVLEQTGDPVYAPQSADPTLVGGGGTYRFSFKAAKSGQATLKLTYARSFEEGEPLKTFVATVTVK